MPLIWPVLTEAERAGLPDRHARIRSRASISCWCSGDRAAVCRRDFQACSPADSIVSPRSARGFTTATPAAPEPGDRVDLSETPARLDDFARRSAVGKRQRPSSINPTHDINASLRKIMDDLQRVAA